MELGVSFMMQWETWGFFQAALGTSGFLLGCNGTRDSPYVAAGESGLIQMEVGKSGSFSSCSGKLDVPL